MGTIIIVYDFGSGSIGMYLKVPGDYVVDSDYVSGVGNGLYFVSKPNDVILLPSDCKYFVSYGLDFNTVAVKSIVIPPSCEFAVIDPLEYLGQKCKIYISRDSEIDVDSIIVDSDDRDMFDIEYY